MFNPEDYAGKDEKIIELYQQLEDWIYDDIAHRILKYDPAEISATSDRLIWKLEQMGEHKKTILKKLAKHTGLTQKELRKILKDAVMTDWRDERRRYGEVGIDISNPLENEAVMRVVDAEYKKGAKELYNLTQTTMDQSQKDLINLLDQAEMRVASGAQSYTSAACDVLDEYAKKGVYVMYGTGATARRMSVEAASRLCTVTSMAQTTAQMTNQYIVEANTNYVLIDAHYGARTAQKGQPPLADHSSWQGRIFCIEGSEPGKPNLEESTGYRINRRTGEGIVTNPLGFAGYNCKHGHGGWTPGMKNPWRNDKGELIDGNGTVITDKINEQRYNDYQKARTMERSIRKTKRELLMKDAEMKSGRMSEEEMTRLQNQYDRMAHRLSIQNQRYNAFKEQADLQEDVTRRKVAGFDRYAAQKARAGANRYQKKIGEVT